MLIILMLIVGIFIGAFLWELLGWGRQGLLVDVRARAAGAARDFRQGFTEGYRRESTGRARPRRDEP